MPVAADAERRRKARRTLALLLLVCAAPVIASYVAYYWLHPTARQLRRAVSRPAPEITGQRPDGRRLPLGLRGGGCSADAARCDARCERKSTRRQARDQVASRPRRAFPAAGRRAKPAWN
jgi:hypothetical protein